MSRSEEMNLDMAGSSGYSKHSDDLIHFRVDLPEERRVPRWRAFNFIFIIPLWVLTGLLLSTSPFLWLFKTLTVLFKGKIPRFLFDFEIAYARYNTRVATFLRFLLEQYPPLEFHSETDDPQTYPAETQLPPFSEKVSRWAILHIIFAIPHYVIMAVLFVMTLTVSFIVFWSALILGTYPAFAHRFNARVVAYLTRVKMYISMFAKNYPRILI